MANCVLKRKVGNTVLKNLMKNKLRNRANDLHDVAKYQVLHLRKNLFECWVQIFQIVSFKDNALTS